MVSLIERAIRGEKTAHPPFWFMRQAGRYLPEYREIRARTKSFLTLCYTPDLAAEVTLQPVKRFGMSAAIIFSDILVVPDAMGVKVDFVAGEGPNLSPVCTEKSIQALSTDVCGHLKPVAQALTQVRSRLDKDTSLIGFCGAPWTVACYMVEGKNQGESWQETRKFALQEPELFSALIEKITDASCEYLLMQIEAGADVIQIFDSWAGVLSHAEYRRWVIAPTQKIIASLRRRYSRIPIIGFPRGSGALYEAYAKEVAVDAVSLDFQLPMKWANKTITKALQGNLDPLIFAYDKNKALEESRKILEIMHGRPFIFNLGHGILPQTPIENVMAVCDLIRKDGA